ncbi:MAG: lipopolysaccharide biosynthesis protein [Candidatus Nanopelagicales bacterium]
MTKDHREPTAGSHREGGLGRIAARGAVVTLSGQGAKIGLQLLGIAVLARILSPADYGLVAMVMVFVSLGEVFRDFGLSAAAVQSPILNRFQRDNLFWANSAIGMVLMLLGVAISEPVAAFFGEPDVDRIMRILSLAFLLNGVGAQYRASLTRGMRFLALTGVEVAAQVLGLAVGIILAVRGAGYWALVSVQLVQAIAALVLLAAVARWRPGRPRRGQDMRHFWVYGSNLVGTQLIGFLTNNVDSLVIGRRFGAESLGVYDRAYRILMVPLAQIRTPSTTVALPVLSRLASDQDRYSQFLVRGQIALGYSVVAALAFAGGAAYPLVEVFLGSGWSASAPIFALLSIAGALQTLSFVGYWVYLSRGLTRALFQYSLISSTIRVGSVVIGSVWGVMGVAWAVALAPALLWPLSLWWLSRVTELPLRALVLGGLRITAMGMSCAVVVRLIVDQMAGSPAAVAVAVAGVTAVGYYLVAGLLLEPIRSDELTLVDTVRRARSSSS